jgi:ParB family chromosome partitioning protein
MVTKLTTRLEPLGAEALRSGLTAFITPAQPVEVEAVPLEMIRFSRHTFRLGHSGVGLEELSEAIKRHGFVGALIGRRKGSMIEVAFGERRVRAAEMAGLHTIPVQVRELDDTGMFELALEENFLYAPLTPLEEAQLFHKMLHEGGYTLETAAQRAARSPQYVSERLLLVQYPEITEALRLDKIEVSTATALAKIEDKIMRAKMLRQALALGDDDAMPSRFIVTSIGLEPGSSSGEEIRAATEAEVALQSWTKGKGKKRKGGPNSMEEQFAGLEGLVGNFVRDLRKQDLSTLARDDNWRKKARKLLRMLEDELDNSYKQLKS